MTTSQAIKKSMANCSVILGGCNRAEFLLAMSSCEISALIAAKIQLNRGLKQPRKLRKHSIGRQTYFNFSNSTKDNNNG